MRVPTEKPGFSRFLLFLQFLVHQFFLTFRWSWPNASANRFFRKLSDQLLGHQLQKQVCCVDSFFLHRRGLDLSRSVSPEAKKKGTLKKILVFFSISGTNSGPLNWVVLWAPKGKSNYNSLTSSFSCTKMKLDSAFLQHAKKVHSLIALMIT